MVVGVARWPGFLFNAQSVTVCRCTMYKGMMRGFCSSFEEEVDV